MPEKFAHNQFWNTFWMPFAQKCLRLKHYCIKLFLVPPYTLHMTNNSGHAVITRFKFMVTKNHTNFQLKSSPSAEQYTHKSQAHHPFKPTQRILAVTLQTTQRLIKVVLLNLKYVSFRLHNTGCLWGWILLLSNSKKILFCPWYINLVS